MMILIGQYDSPFVRRVAIAARLYGMAFEHRPWSTFADAERVGAFNPLRRVPTLVLDDGDVLIESGAILDYLDDSVGPSRALIARHGPGRCHALKVCALATGMADKAVSLIYEQALHQAVSDQWVQRCRTQIAAVLDALAVDRAGRTTPHWFGDAIGHADIAVACVLRFLADAHPDLFDPVRWRPLADHAARCEAMPVFKEISQAFLPPARD
jgi:glutathione S-transferase